MKGITMTEPRGWPLCVNLWRRHRNEPPIALLRCGAERGRCRREVGQLWRTAEGILLHAHADVPADKRAVSIGEGVTDDDVSGALEGRAKWAAGESHALMLPLPTPGRVCLVDRDDYWIPVLRISCGRARHGELTHKRAELMDAARRGTPEKPQEVSLPPIQHTDRVD